MLARAPARQEGCPPPGAPWGVLRLLCRPPDQTTAAPLLLNLLLLLPCPSPCTLPRWRCCLPRASHCVWSLSASCCRTATCAAVDGTNTTQPLLLHAAGHPLQPDVRYTDIPIQLSPCTPASAAQARHAPTFTTGQDFLHSCRHFLGLHLRASKRRRHTLLPFLVWRKQYRPARGPICFTRQLPPPATCGCRRQRPRAAAPRPRRATGRCLLVSRDDGNTRERLLARVLVGLLLGRHAGPAPPVRP